MFIDVLEHLENPRELLKVASATSEYLLVRQPLLENFSTFRHKNYRHQREQWGHIAYFSYYSFLDLLESEGWVPQEIDLIAPWELHTIEGLKKHSYFKKKLTKFNKPLMSYLISGFYLNGIFRKL